MNLFNDMEVEIVNVTPELAANWLTLVRPNQRNVDRRTVDMLHREFKHNGAQAKVSMAILFDTKGRLADGVHRLTMMVKYGLSAVLCVRRNVTEEELYAIHNCRPRSTSDQIKMQFDSAYPKEMSAVGRLIYHRWYTGKLKAASNVESYIKLSAEEIVGVFRDLAIDADDLVRRAKRIHARQPADANYFSPTCIAYALVQAAPEIELWLTNLVSDTADRTNAQIALRTYARNHRKQRKTYELFAAMAKAYNHPELKFIKVVESDVADLNEGRFAKERWPQ